MSAMRQASPRWSARTDVRLTLIGAAYFAAHWLAFLFPDAEKVLMAFWPAGGVGLAALLLNPRRLWPGILAVLFVTGNLANWLGQRPLLASAGFMTTNVLESLACAWLMQYGAGERIRFQTAKEIKLLLLAATAANSVTALLGAGTAALASGAAFWSFYCSWWIADGLGILLVAPLVVCWAADWRKVVSQWAGRGLEALAATAAAVWACWLSFGPTNQHFGLIIRPYMLYLPLVWTALRFGVAGAASSTAITGAVALFLTATGQSLFPLGGADMPARVLMVQLFVGVAGTVSMLLAASRTEQAVTARQLRESQERFSAAFRSNPTALGISRPDGTLLEVNEAFCALFGYGREELLGRTVLELGLWVNPAQRENMLAAARRQQERQQIEAKFRRKSGETIIATVGCEFIELGGERCLVASFVDVTARRHAEQEIERLAAERNLILQTLTIGVSFVRDRRVLSANAAYDRIFGLANGESVGMETRGFYVRAEDYERIEREASSVFAKGAEVHAEAELRGKDGRVFPCAMSGRAVTPGDAASGSIWQLEDITERKRAEQAERETRYLFESVINRTPAYVFVIDRQHRFLLNNEAHAKSLNRVAAEMRGRTYRDFFPEDLARLFHADNEAVMAGGQAVQFDETVLGEVKLASKFPLRNEQGEVTGMGAVIIDITQRKHAEAALRQSEQNLRAFFDTIHDFAWVLDQQGNILHVNATVTERLGYPEAELIGQNVLVVHPVDRREEAARIVGEMLAGRCEACPIPLVTRSGVQIPVETRITPGYWDNGKALFGISKDISALLASEEKFSKAFHSNPALMAVTELADGRYLEVNSSFLQTLGFSREEVIGRSSRELGLFADPAQREFLLKELRERFSLRNVEVGVKAKHGEQRTGLFAADLMQLQGRPVLLTVMVDITERIAAEAKVRALLRQTQLDAMAKAELLKEVNHRVKNNLVAILGLALAEQRQLAPNEEPLVKEFVGDLRRRIEGLLAVHQMLSSSQWAPLAVSDLASKIIVAATASTPPGSKVVLEVASSPIKVSPRQASNLALVLNELATNTIKHGLAGRTVARILFRASEAGHQIRLEYRDDGPGYPPEVLRQERSNVGLGLVRDLVTETLRGEWSLANDGGAVAIMVIPTEEPNRT